MKINSACLSSMIILLWGIISANPVADGNFLNSSSKKKRKEAKTRFLKIITACTVIVLAISSPKNAQSKSDLFDDLAAYQIGDGFGQMTASAIKGASDFVRGAADFSAQVQMARQNFWNAYPSKPNRKKAEAEFARLLAVKDLYHLIMSIPEGYLGPRARLANALAEIDGGVRPPARPAFIHWVDAIRKNLGAKDSRDFVIPLPSTLARAINATQSQYKAYLAERDRAEYIAAGREPEWVKTPEDRETFLTGAPGSINSKNPKRYALALIKNSPSFSYQKSWDNTKKQYAYYVKEYGEAKVLELAEKVRTAPRRDGFIANKEEVGCGVGYSERCFLALLTVEWIKKSRPLCENGDEAVCAKLRAYAEGCKRDPGWEFNENKVFVREIYKTKGLGPIVSEKPREQPQMPMK